MAFPPANSRYDKYDKADHDAAVLAVSKDPVIQSLVKPPLTRVAVPQEAPPPLLRQAAVMPSGPYKFSDKGPEKPEKGNLQAEEDQRQQRPLPPHAGCALSRGPASGLRTPAGFHDLPVRHEAQGLGT
jgi:hypothetical protein